MLPVARTPLSDRAWPLCSEVSHQKRDSVNLTACEFGCHGVASSASLALRYQCPSPSPCSTDPPAWQFQSSCHRPASAHAHIIANEHLRWTYVRESPSQFCQFCHGPSSPTENSKLVGVSNRHARNCKLSVFCHRGERHHELVQQVHAPDRLGR